MTAAPPPTGNADVQGTVSAKWTQDSTSTPPLHAGPLFCPADLCTRLGLLSSLGKHMVLSMQGWTNQDKLKGTALPIGVTDTSNLLCFPDVAVARG